MTPTPTRTATPARAYTAHPALLDRQLAWMVRLRWLAASATILGGIVEATLLRWYGTGPWIAATGIFLFLANTGFWYALPPQPADSDTNHPAAPKQPLPKPFPQRKQRLYALAWAQILIDLLSLTFLVALTDGTASPLRGFFVFHMVFASLLLPTTMAFAVAFLAIAMVEIAMLLTEHRTRTLPTLAISLGWDLTLLTTVYLASEITGRLRRQRRRLLRQNARIRRLAEQLRRQQAALVQQEKMVTMGQMAAGVAHEVSNPLASMDGLLQLMERRPDRVTAENLARLREQILRINTIVRQLTTLAHPRVQGTAAGAAEAGEEFFNANLNDLVTRVLDVLRFDHRLKNVTVEKNLDPHLPASRFQAGAIEQVLINLIINAIDAMESVPTPPGPTLRITTTNLPAATPPAIELSIQDNGTGVPPEIKNRLFEPFFTTKPVGKGTGLGLSISLAVIRRHHGDLTLHSPPPNAPAGTSGTTMLIHLPLQG